MPPPKRTIARLAFVIFVAAIAIASILFASEGSPPIAIDTGGGITLNPAGVTTGTNGLVRGNILGRTTYKWGMPLDSSIYRLFPNIKPVIWSGMSGMPDGLSFWFSVSSQTPVGAKMNIGRGRFDIFWNNDRSSVARMRIEISDTNNVPPDGGFGGGYSGNGYFRIDCVLPAESESSYRLRFFVPGEQGDWKIVTEIPVKDLK